MLGKSVVIKLGGSLLFNEQNELKKEVIEKVVEWTRKYLSLGGRIVIVVGGGRLSRFVVNQSKQMDLATYSLHKTAMLTTQINAEIVRGALQEFNALSPISLGNAFELLLNESNKCVVTGGLVEGWSTDMDAAILADILDIDRVYKISKIDHLYTSDPEIDQNAKPIKDISWKSYFRMFNIVPGHTKHKPGLSVPIDSTCAQFCLKKKISFFVAGGSNLPQFKNFNSFVENGSYIHP